MPQNYTPEFKKKIVHLHEEEGRTYKVLLPGMEYQNQPFPNGTASYVKNTKKGKSLPKKSSGILCKGNRLEAYRFIEQHHTEFGLRWLLRRLNICPNAYYNYRKHRKSAYYTQKSNVQELIREIYHAHNGVDGYRTMQVYLERKGFRLSLLTVHKYMNTEMGLKSIAHPKKPGYMHRKPYKILKNKRNQDFHADAINQKWRKDFTYLFLKGGEVRYNCRIIDLHDRSVVASITDRNITSDLAIRTLKKTLDSQPAIKGELILNNDQGSQFTSKAFVEYCEAVHVTKSMSKAGYLYDNAPMERYFNTLKNECIDLYSYKTQEALYQAVEEFAYIT